MRFKFIKTVAKYEQCPPAKGAEILIVGRSNAGKSSLINAMANEKVAFVSANPGRTVLLNFYQAGVYRIVDSPGYGFSLGEKHDRVVSDYIHLRSTLSGVLLVMDVRRRWTELEQMLVDFVGTRELPWAIVATKVDKLNRRDYEGRLRELQKVTPRIFPVSSLKKTGIKELQKFLLENWGSPRENSGL